MGQQSFIRLALVTLVPSTLVALVLGFSDTVESTGAGPSLNPVSSTEPSVALETSPLECQACCRHQAGDGWDDRASYPCSVLKIDPALAGDATCTPVQAKDGALGMMDLCPMKLAEGPSEKRVSVAALVDQALKDQVAFLRARAQALERWSPADQARFALWFGTTNDGARALIHRRLTVLGKINAAYTFKNFRRARHRPGVFAYVHPTDPSHPRRSPVNGARNLIVRIVYPPSNGGPKTAARASPVNGAGDTVPIGGGHSTTSGMVVGKTCQNEAS